MKRARINKTVISGGDLLWHKKCGSPLYDTGREDPRNDMVEDQVICYCRTCDRVLSSRSPQAITYKPLIKPKKKGATLVVSGILIVGGIIFASLSTGINPLFSAIAVIAGAVGVAISIALYMARRPTIAPPQPVWQAEIAWAGPSDPIVYSMKQIAKVRLDTEVEAFVSHSEVFEKGDEIEIRARSFGQESFHLFVCNVNDFNTNQRRSKNFERLDGVEFTTFAKKKLTIPETGVWFFMAYTPEGEEDAIVQLTIWKLQYDGLFDWSKPWTMAPEPQIKGLSATVAGLVDTGELNDDQGNSLISKLKRALVSLDQGKVNPAIRQLQAFISQVNSFIDERVLSPEEVGSLIAQADAVVEQLGR